MVGALVLYIGSRRVTNARECMCYIRRIFTPMGQENYAPEMLLPKKLMLVSSANLPAPFTPALWD